MTDETLRPRRMLTVLAWKVAAELNCIDGDDERELLHEHFETVLNDELYSGSLNRVAAQAAVKRALSSGEVLGDGLLMAALGMVDRDGRLAS